MEPLALVRARLLPHLLAGDEKDSSWPPAGYQAIEIGRANWP
jgi:hypothetical protein